MNLDPRQTPISTDRAYDVAVLGAGFGGIGAALELARSGLSVVLLEKMSYAGGCAATFHHRKRGYEAGATLSAGLGPTQLFGGWIKEYDLPLEIRPLDPVVRFRAPDFHFDVPADRNRFVEALATRPGADADAVRRFFAMQKGIADALWSVLDDTELLPPFGWSGLWAHVRRSPAYLKILPRVGKSLGTLLTRAGLDDDRNLRLLIDAVSQITLQGSADEIEAPFALTTLDYFFRGTGHVTGGLGALAEGLLEAFRREGGEYRAACGVRGLSRRGEDWVVHTRAGALRARRVISNLQPAATNALIDGEVERERRRTERLDAAVRGGWGAVMLYLDIDLDRLPGGGPQHLELVDRADEALIEGNHVFCSVGGPGDRPADDPWRPVTVSTHLRMEDFVGAPNEEQRERIEAVQSRMRETIRRRAPELHAAIQREMTASPRTFQRFTGRDEGYVGGVPRRTGLGAYRICAAPEVAPGLRLVGDATFPGQSILATASGGVKAARLVAADL